MPKEPFFKKTNRDFQCSFSLKTLKDWVEKGLVPPDLAQRYISQAEKESSAAKRYQEFKKNNPDASKKEEKEFLLQELKKGDSQSKSDSSVLVEFVDFLVKNLQSLTSKTPATIKKGKPLFKEIPDDSFGISTAMAYLMNHLPKLMKKAKLIKTGEQSWKVTCKVIDSQNKNVCLEYDFDATTKKEADLQFNSYKKMMLGDGLRTWMAYWATASLLGSLECECPMIEVMKLTANPNRKSATFGGNEKQKHWNITKKLRRTILKARVMKNKEGTRTRFRERPLLTILGGEEEIENADKYPSSIAFNVLTSEKKSNGFSPAIYKLKTLERPTKRTLLSFYIQTRASQRERGSIPIEIDWALIFTLSNLDITAKSNPRQAKVRALKELRELKKIKIIETFIETTYGVLIHPVPKIKNEKNSITTKK